MSDPLATEFRPVATARTSRLLLGLAMTAVLLPLTAWAIALVWLPARLSYAVSADVLTVNLDRGLWQRHRSFRLDGLTSAAPVTLRGGSRLRGTALPGYCVGTYSYADLGRVWQATTCCPTAVALAFGPRRVVLSPADRDGLLASATGRRPGNFAAAPGKPPGAGWLGVRLVVALSAIAVLAVPAVFFLAPGRLRYELRAGELTVVTLLARRRLALTAAVARRLAPRPGIKLAGSAIPGYYSGLFQLEGRSTHVYATSLRDGVLVEGRRRYFLSPADPEVFLAALVRAGARVEASAPGTG